MTEELNEGERRRERMAVQGPFSENTPTTSEAANAILDGRITPLSGFVDDVCVSLDEEEKEISTGTGPEKQENWTTWDHLLRPSSGPGWV
ncbi:hypothetical protein PUN28_001040 [Cardiocondyla obscurior]|uniref:Uncharacterized protein n=1 Tax=Cardiocondyla obscurior TaxID=286306 RepID=A0AAW2H2I9_9HYME